MFELKDMKTYEDYKMTDTSDKIVLERKGTVGYICPNCRHMTEIDLDWNINMLTKRNTGKVFALWPSLRIQCIYCDKCWVTDDIGIDANMIRAIKYFNDIDILTLNCCEGHVGKTESLPYIQFADDKIKKYELPKDWKLKESNNNTFTLTYCGKFETEEDKVIALSLFYHWMDKTFGGYNNE